VVSGQKVKYNHFFIYTPFQVTHLQVRPLARFSHLMAQMTHILTQRCAFLALVDITVHLGDQIAPKPKFCGHE